MEQFPAAPAESEREAIKQFIDRSRPRLRPEEITPLTNDLVTPNDSVDSRCGC